MEYIWTFGHQSVWLQSYFFSFFFSSLCAKFSLYRNTGHNVSHVVVVFFAQTPIILSLHVRNLLKPGKMEINIRVMSQQFIGEGKLVIFYLFIQPFTHKCLFPQQWVVSVYFYSLVPVLQSEECLSRVVC